MPNKVFSVQLKKQQNSLGMKLVYDKGQMVVTRFKKLADGEIGPAELSKVIAPNDVVCAINGMDLKGFLFSQVS